MEEKLTEKDINEICEDIRFKYSEGKIILMTAVGVLVVDAKEMIDQSADGILYDLNRDEATTITLAKSGELESRFINDLAVANVIRSLKDRIDYLERTLKGHIVDEK